MSDNLAKEIESRFQALPEHNVPALRILRREYSRRIAKESAASVLKLAKQFLRSGDSYRRFLAYELIHHHPESLVSLRESDLEKLGKGMASWEAVDMFGCFLAGPAWREGQIGDAVIQRWAKSPDRWWRRAALVSTVPLNNKTRGGHGDAPRTLKICRLLVADRDDMVVKAMSWALRELAKRDASAVRRFVADQEEMLAPRVLREVKNKITTGLKNPPK